MTRKNKSLLEPENTQRWQNKQNLYRSDKGKLDILEGKKSETWKYS